MPFNSNSYHRNKCRRSALINLAEARAIKARVAAGEAYDWEASRIPLIVMLARSDWRLYLLYRKIGKGFE